MNKAFRKAYSDASKQESKLKVLEELIAQEKEESAVLLAYKAGFQALKGNYAFFPAMKLAYFWECSKLFDKALELEPDNLEVIFLRFTIECGVPSIMSYALHLQKDKKSILELLPNSNFDKEFKKAMIDFMFESGKLTESEEKILKSV
ncbi:hypothetical protein AD998_11265 [bacterium 336/3]|nr:hypothetical protein AD998_11265 [bacterium 336/3]